jgi:hypothetical protein
VTSAKLATNAETRREVATPPRANRNIQTTLKLTPRLKRWLEFIAGGGERGRMVLQITASGGRAGSQLQVLRNAGWVEYCDDPDDPSGPDRVRLSDVGRKTLANSAKEPITYRRDEDRYIVYLGEDRLGFVRRETDGRWRPSIRGWRGPAGSRRAMRPVKRCCAVFSR